MAWCLINYEDNFTFNCLKHLCNNLRFSPYLSIYLSVALQPFVGPGPLFQFLYLFTQPVGLLGREISTSQDRYTYTQGSTDTE
jgi:hypothetical protein